MNLSASAFRQQHTSVVTEDDKAAFQAFVGYRFVAPKWIKETVEQAMTWPDRLSR